MSAVGRLKMECFCNLTIWIVGSAPTMTVGLAG